MENKLFTQDEANALLPQLKEDLQQLQTLMIEFKNRHIQLEKKKTWRRLHRTADQGDPDPFFEEESRLDFLRLEIDVRIDNFQRKGVLLKMISPGLIDFPAVVDGEPALICWQEGEERISHYHGWHDGLQGRKPLPDD